MMFWNKELSQLFVLCGYPQLKDNPCHFEEGASHCEKAIHSGRSRRKQLFVSEHARNIKHQIRKDIKCYFQMYFYVKALITMHRLSENLRKI